MFYIDKIILKKNLSKGFYGIFLSLKQKIINYIKKILPNIFVFFKKKEIILLQILT